MFHLEGHHKIYPDARHCRSLGASYQGGTRATNSAFSLLPTLVVQAGLLWLLLPLTWSVVSVVEMCVLLVALNVIHEQFHVERSFLERFRWFTRARAAHDVHHDASRNFMVADHLWDRCFGTFASR